MTRRVTPVGGFRFSYNAKRGLWCAPSVDSPYGLYVIDDAIIAPSWGQYTVRIGGNFIGPTAAATPPKPAAASHLWDNPDTVVGEIIAYRAWDYDTTVADDGSVAVRLESRHNAFYWDGPVATADAVPTTGNDRGIYAIGAGEHHRDNYAAYVEDAPVWGRVALSGIVVEGCNGYRAERAAIQELWVSPSEIGDDSAKGLCKVLGDRYQCDVSVRTPNWSDLAEMSK